jgi:hypothetical protein
MQLVPLRRGGAWLAHSRAVRRVGPARGDDLALKPPGVQAVKREEKKPSERHGTIIRTERNNETI